jgi:SAM-dependent methyltransferase
MRTVAEAAPFASGAEASRCRACGQAGLEPFAVSRAVPVNNARVFPRRADARAVPAGEIELAFCPGCGFIGNLRYDGGLVAYSAGYEEQQSYSPTFNAFSDALARGLVERWNLRDKRIVEIGCGKGDFLAELCRLGPNHGVGIDPTVAPERVGAAPGGRLRLVSELYGPRTGALHADAVVCRHTLEHIHDVGAFVRTLRRSLDASPGARIFFEVPDVLRVLAEGAFWDVYYEHCSYFSAGSLARLFRHEGFAVDDVRLGFGDQYVLLEARIDPAAAARSPLPAEETPEALRSAVAAYALRARATIDGWRDRVRGARARGERVVVWGSGSKCVAFLSETGLEDEIDAVVDVNPHRQGRFLPTSGIEVGAPESLRALRPDVVVVMNSAYSSEIGAALAAMELYPAVEAVG